MTRKPMHLGIVVIAAVCMASCGTDGRSSNNIISGLVVKAEKGEATLGDWDNASNDEKTKYASNFVQTYCGKDDPALEEGIIAYLNASISDMKKKMPDAAPYILKDSKLDTSARAAARLMGFSQKKQE